MVAKNPCSRCGGPKNVGDGYRCQKCRRKADARKRASAKAHARRILETYGITADEYTLILAHQDGVCYICRRAPGAKRLAVDHDHRGVGAPVRDTVRGLLCRNCNRFVLGHLGDDAAALRRAITYLRRPPARGILR